MEFNEVISALEGFKDTQEYKDYIKGLSNVTPDGVKEYLATEEGKKLLQPQMDSYFSKGLETWKTNNLETLVSEELKRRNPELDEKDIELQKVKAQLESIQQEATREKLMNKALKVSSEKNLPNNLIQFFVGDSEETTLENINNFEKAFNDAVSQSVNTKIKNNTHIPNSGTDNKELSIDDLNNMSVDEINLYYKNLKK